MWQALVRQPSALRWHSAEIIVIQSLQFRHEEVRGRCDSLEEGYRNWTREEDHQGRFPGTNYWKGRSIEILVGMKVEKWVGSRSTKSLRHQPYFGVRTLSQQLRGTPPDCDTEGTPGKSVAEDMGRQTRSLGLCSQILMT